MRNKNQQVLEQAAQKAGREGGSPVSWFSQHRGARARRPAEELVPGLRSPPSPCSETRCAVGSVSRPHLAALGKGGPSKLALQSEPTVLTCPPGFLIPPKATIPIVLVVSYLLGTQAPTSCHPNLPFGAAAAQGQQVGNVDELWRRQLEMGRPLDTFIHFSFHSSRL